MSNILNNIKNLRRPRFTVHIYMKGNPLPVVLRCYKFDITRSGSELTKASWELVQPWLGRYRQVLFLDITQIASILINHND